MWSFVKGAGKKLVGRAEASEAPSEDVLMKEVEDLGLDTEGVTISVEGDQVKVGGTTVSQEMKEKIILAVGNIEGVAAVSDEVGGGKPVFHTGVKGDNLSKIAKVTLGNANRYPEIFEANKPMLTHPDKIYPRQVLRIPQD